MPNAMGEIEHIVVVMLENRSFDHLVGWLYADTGNRPPRNLPATGGAPTYDGLVEDRFWCPANAAYLKDPSVAPWKVYVRRGTAFGELTVPDPGPAESYDRLTFQLFGTSRPAPGQVPSMQGFVVDYQASVPPEQAVRIMETYTPDQVPVLSALARSYAISDRWFASVPAQTWPNRAFVHCGTSAGHVNNAPYTPYDLKTLYEALDEAQVSWGIYAQAPIPVFGTQAQLQLKRLRAFSLRRHFASFAAFKQQARDGTLPAYSFIEPALLEESVTGIPPSDMHAPHSVGDGDRFLFEVFQALSTGKRWSRTLLVITFDEHGGMYDHVPPPWGATPPDAASRSGEAGFGFDRFGVRVPTILVSPWIEPGTVFRSPTNVPYDHTSILRTLRDWAGLPDDVLPSARIRNAPSFASVLTRTSPRQDLPSLRPGAQPAPGMSRAMAGLALQSPRTAPLPPSAVEPTEQDARTPGLVGVEEPDRSAEPIDDLQRSMLAGVARELETRGGPPAVSVMARVKTKGDLAAYLKFANQRAPAVTPGVEPTR